MDEVKLPKKSKVWNLTYHCESSSSPFKCAMAYACSCINPSLLHRLHAAPAAGFVFFRRSMDDVAVSVLLSVLLAHILYNLHFLFYVFYFVSILPSVNLVIIFGISLPEGGRILRNWYAIALQLSISLSLPENCTDVVIKTSSFGTILPF